MSELLRLLAARSEHGYTDRLAHALREEPEAVSADEQQQLTRAAARSAKARTRSDWQARRDRIAAELDAVRTLSYARDVAPELRVAEQALARLHRRALAALDAVP